jgi:F0F1-type ATP synthase assembly protein I
MNKFNKNLQKAIGVSSTILGSILFFGIIGFFLKNKFDNPIWLIVCLILGSVVGLYDLYKQINK